MILLNIIITPLSIVFPEHFHDNEEAIDWVGFELFLNSLWLIDFFINLNRVDFRKKIVSFKDTFRNYRRSTMIPDAIAAIGSISFCLAKKMLVAKYFDLIRLIRFRDVLLPIKLVVIRTTSLG